MAALWFYTRPESADTKYWIPGEGPARTKQERQIQTRGKETKRQHAAEKRGETFSNSSAIDTLLLNKDYRSDVYRMPPERLVAEEKRLDRNVRKGTQGLVTSSSLLVAKSTVSTGNPLPGAALIPLKIAATERDTQRLQMVREEIKYQSAKPKNRTSEKRQRFQSQEISRSERKSDIVSQLKKSARNEAIGQAVEHTNAKETVFQMLSNMFH
jgi:hypothetical protein